jgi:flavin-dependent dehydrogenase
MSPHIFSSEVRIPLENRSKILVIGGGPAGAFFARELLSRARTAGRQIEVSIVEQKKTPRFYQTSCPSVYREGCNFCAGGISPRMSDVLQASGLEVPKEVVTGEIEKVIVQGDWKHIELKVPPGRHMFSVHRGSRPAGRTHRFENFDAYLLGCAVTEGAHLLSGEVHEVAYSTDGRPIVYAKSTGEDHAADLQLEADFVVFAGGVNPTAGVAADKHPLVRILGRLVTGFRSPLVRQALIFELRPRQGTLSDLFGEAYFVQYGSADLEIETASFISKKEFITVSLLGPCVDKAHPSEYLSIIKRLLELPHIRRLLPRNLELGMVCVCSPNMTVGTATHPFGHRIAVIGDLVVARLYKDGILSAYQTAHALVECLLIQGLDQESLKKHYWPAVRKFTTDNRFGRFVFWTNRVAFSHPILSRILYQSVLTERKGKSGSQRRLENLLWRIAAGDDTYQRIFFSMMHPANLWAILAGGILVTGRNYLTEVLFGLKWTDFGRYPTGVYLEELEEKRQEVKRELKLGELHGQMDFERMYSIQIKAEKAQILWQLERFGAEDMEYFRPRWVRIRRSHGQPNALGTTIRYETSFHFADFTLRLENFLRGEYLLYRVQNGFANGGVSIFDIKPQREGIYILSIYVAFNMPRGVGLLKRIYWTGFRLLFPGYLHDVLWNHSLCKIKDIAETSSHPV